MLAHLMLALNSLYPPRSKRYLVFPYRTSLSRSMSVQNPMHVKQHALPRCLRVHGLVLSVLSKVLPLARSPPPLPSPPPCATILLLLQRTPHIRLKVLIIIMRLIMMTLPKLSRLHLPIHSSPSPKNSSTTHTSPQTSAISRPLKDVTRLTELIVGVYAEGRKLLYN